MLCEQRGSYLTSAIGYNVGLDRRNDPSDPTRGYYINLNQDLAGIGGTVHYLKTEVRGAYFYGFTKDFIFSLLRRRRLCRRLERQHHPHHRPVSIWAATPSGASRSPASGRAIRSIGDSLGGKLSAVGTAEITLPTKLPEQYGIKLALFTDFGTLGVLDRANKINPNTNATLTTVQDDLGLSEPAPAYQRLLEIAAWPPPFRLQSDHQKGLL